MDVLELAESLDSYRTKCAASYINSAARYRDIYELDSISKSATSFLQREAAKSPFIASNCEIAILDSSADSGLPHTRPPNLICLPAAMCKAEGISDEFKTTLLHEGIHVHQRLYPDIWKKACTSAGWKEIPREKIPEEFAKITRLNPDTMASPYWAWDNQVPIPVFPNLISPKLSSTKIQWYDLSTEATFHKPPQSLLSKVKGASDNTITELEHPYELYAYEFSKKGINSHEKIMAALAEL